MKEWGTPNQDIPKFVFPHRAGLGGVAWAPLPHSTSPLLSCGVAFADSCEGRCEEGFDAGHKCQCDTLCVYYQSCCSDYSTVCKAKGTVPTATLLARAQGEWVLHSLGSVLGQLCTRLWLRGEVSTRICCCTGGFRS